MRRSEVFDNFAKIMDETSLISKGSPESVKEELEKTRRMDSLSIEQIAKLYGVKPDSPKEMHYERNIAEVAHPEPLVIAPSHDKLNGLIENINERQNILLHIVNKPSPDGHLTQRKYAERELILSLVRIGNDLDNRGQDQLANLSDICLAQASHLKKEAFWPLAIAVSSLLGTLYAKQHLSFHSDGLEADIQKAVGELDDLLTSNSNFGVGYDYKPQLISLANDVKNKLHELDADMQKMSALLNTVKQPRTAKEAVALGQQPDNQEIAHALQEFRQKVEQNLLPYFRQVIANFQDETFKQQQVAHKGLLSQMVDATGVLHGGAGLISDNMDDVAHALQTVLADVQTIAKGLEDASHFSAQTAQQLQQATPEATAPTTSIAPGAPPAVSVPPVSLPSLEKELEDEDLTG